MNRIFLSGFVATEPEFDDSRSFSICKFRLGMKKRKAKGYTYIRITTFRQIADYANEYVKKGAIVSIVGSLEITDYEDAEGIKRMGVEISADDIEIHQMRATHQNDTEQGDKAGEPFVPTACTSLPF